MLSSDPAFSEANLSEIAVDISLEVSWAILKIFHGHGVSTYDVDTFNKPTFRTVGKKIFELAKANFDESLE
jgi:hypothetical protein